MIRVKSKYNPDFSLVKTSYHHDNLSGVMGGVQKGNVLSPLFLTYRDKLMRVFRTQRKPCATGRMKSRNWNQRCVDGMKFKENRSQYVQG